MGIEGCVFRKQLGQDAGAAERGNTDPDLVVIFGLEFRQFPEKAFFQSNDLAGVGQIVLSGGSKP